MPEVYDDMIQCDKCELWFHLGCVGCFHHCGSPVKLVQACICVGSTLQRHFHRRGGAVKHVQAFLSTRKDGEISFLHCGSPVKLAQANCANMQ